MSKVAFLRRQQITPSPKTEETMRLIGQLTEEAEARQAAENTERKEDFYRSQEVTEQSKVVNKMRGVISSLSDKISKFMNPNKKISPISEKNLTTITFEELKSDEIGDQKTSLSMRSVFASNKVDAQIAYADKVDKAKGGVGR